MKKSISILAGALLWLPLLAQKPPIKFGDVPMEDLKMQVYPKDSSAVAVVLADFGESNILYNQSKNSFELVFERIRRVKVLKTDGLDFANFTVELYGRGGKDEDISGLRAVAVVEENGKAVETKSTKSDVFQEKVNENWTNVKIAIPGVKVGAVIDVSYRVTSPYLFNFQDWEFQSTIPVAWSEYIAHVPEFFDYQKFSQGYVLMAINEETKADKNIILTYKERTVGNSKLGVTQTTMGQERVQYTETTYRWVATDVPGFTEEPYMTNYRDYMSKINFELASIRMPNRPVEHVMGSWDQINKEFVDDSNFGVLIRRTGSLGSVAEQQIRSKETDQDKVLAIFNFVRQQVEWDGKYRKYASNSLKKVLDEKKGSSADVNLLLIALLREANIKADPVLVSTRNHGFVRQHIPMSSQFNYVIALVQLGEDRILLDATDRSLPITALPERCLNGQGFLVSETGYNWVPLSTNERSRTATTFDVKISDNGEVTGKVSTSYHGYAAQHTRVAYHKKGQEEYLKDRFPASGWDVANSAFENLKELDQPLKESHDVQIAEYSQVAGNTIIFSPFVDGGLGDNPFKLEKRNFPVDFGYQFEQTHVGKFEIPEGYVVDESPQPKVLALPNRAARYLYSITVNGSIINFTSQLTINQALFGQDAYPNLREFYAQVVAKQQELIVLKKQQ